MTITISALPLIIAIAGGILFFLTSQAKLSRIGEILFFVGMLAFLLARK